MKSTNKTLWLIIPAVAVITLAAVIAILLQPRKPVALALAALESNSRVEVSHEPWLTFEPRESLAVGFILYPGSKVRPEAYAVLAQGIAEAGYLVVVPKMPVNMAVFGWEEATGIIKAYPDIENWAIGGHSLGGVMASRYILNHPGDLGGLILWASYPADSYDLSERDISVTSIYASLDGLASTEEVLASRPNLPADTVWVELEGGNHAQFGNYGEQPGDLPATIPAVDQQKQVVQATLERLRGLRQQQ